MSHQPFEEWILDGEGLSDEQRQALADHVAGCRACARLGLSLAAVERTLGQADVAEPAPGFVGRFTLRLEGQRARSGRRQAWGAFGLAAAGAVALAAPIVSRLSGEWTSPGAALVEGVIRLYDAWVALRVTGEFVRAAWNNLPGVVPPVWALGLVAACLGMGVVWIATLYRFAFRRVTEGA